MDDTKSEIREKLKIFVQELKAQKFPETTMSVELAEFVADAIEKYLEGKAKSLDAAFGLTSKRGAPGDPKYRENCARKILELQLEGKSQKEIYGEFPREEASNLRRYLKEFESLLWAERITKNLSKDDK